MIITFYNKKGGVGKTNLSYCVARKLGYYLLSNDYSIIEKSYQEMTLINKNILSTIKQLKEQGEDVVVDLGGFITEETQEILQISDKVLIPTITDWNSTERTISTYEESLENNLNTYVIGNILKHKKDTEDMIRNLNEEGIEVSLMISESRIFHNALKDKSTFDDELLKYKSMYEKGSIVEEFNKLIEFVGGEPTDYTNENEEVLKKKRMLLKNTTQRDIFINSISNGLRIIDNASKVDENINKNKDEIIKKLKEIEELMKGEN